MRMRSWAALLAIAAVLPGRVQAQPEPTVEVRVRSVNDLLDRAEYVGGLVDKDEPVKQIKQLVKSLETDGKGVEGIDPARPIGAYAVIATDVESSPVVVMIPIADEDRFLKMLKDRVDLTPQKADGGALKVNVPILNEAYFRFADGYLYAAREAKHIAAKSLVPPKTLFGKDDGAVAAITVRLDRVPAELKEFVTGNFEHRLQERLRAEAAGKTDAQRKLEGVLADVATGTVKALADDGKTLAVKVFVDAKTDELSAEVALTAKDGSTLAKTLAGAAGKASRPGGIVAVKNPTLQFATKAGLPDDVRKRLDPLVDGLIEDAVKKAGENERAAVRRALTTLAPTLKAGDLDAAVSLSAPDAKGNHTLLAAAVVKDGKDIEKLVKDFAALARADDAAFSFDVDTVGGFALHKVEVKKPGADFERVFGTRTVWLATSADCVALSVEPDGAALKAGLKAGPAVVPVLGAEVAWAKAVPLFEKDLKPDEVKALLKDAFGGEPAAGKDAVRVTVEGGDRLTARLVFTGKAFRLAYMLGEYKKK